MSANAAFGAPSIPLAIAFATVVVWLVTEGAAWRRARRARIPGAGPPVRADAGSFWAVIVSIWVGVEVAFLCEAFRIGWFLPGDLWPVGLAVAAVGIGVRVWAIVTLGRFFSPVVQIERDHRIVRAGPYRWVRHPSYTGLLLTLVGVGLTVGAVTGVALALAIAAVPFGYRIRVEERALAARFGAEWTEYARSTWRLFPGVF